MGGRGALAILLSLGSASATQPRDAATCYTTGTTRTALQAGIASRGDRICFYGHCIGTCEDCSPLCGEHGARRESQQPGSHRRVQLCLQAIFSDRPALSLLSLAGQCYMRYANETKPPLGTNEEGLSESYGYPRECNSGASCEGTSQLGFTWGNLLWHENSKDNCCHGTTNGAAVQYEMFPPVAADPEDNEYIRYCMCDEGWMGSACEIQMQPWIPWAYVFGGLIFTTGLAIGVSGVGAFLDFNSPDRKFKETMTNKKGEEVEFKWGAAQLVFQYYLMGCGAFVYSVAWTDNFFLITFLRNMSRFFMGAFEVIGDLVLPDDYTNNDSTAIKMCFAIMVPTFLIAQTMASATTNPKTKKKVYSYGGAIIIYNIMPMITIPVVGTLFRPIVGCHFDSSDMNPQPLSPEDESTRSIPIEMQFLPVDMRKDCAFGDQQETYFWLGIGLMIPFWALGLYLGSGGKTDNMPFPVHKGYHVMHTQLMVLVAMAYRAFKMRHPMYLVTMLFLVNVIELVLILVFKPNDHLPINRLRLYVNSLALMWSFVGFLAQVINDRTSMVSAILLVLGTLVWGGGVAFMMSKSGEDDEAPKELELQADDEGSFDEGAETDDPED